jgi:hypothetical protein
VEPHVEGVESEAAAPAATTEEAWPSLPLEAWKDTKDTLHMWMQMVGKLRLALSPEVNHWWHVPLYVTSRGLTTSPVPCDHRTFDVDFDLCTHELQIRVSDGRGATLPLRPCAVADFYRELKETLRTLDIEMPIWPVPVEVPDPIPFPEDHRHASYAPLYAHRFWQVLMQADRQLKAFRSRFIAKASPVQFFWGGCDLCVSVFSGRPAPEHADVPGVPRRVVREAYSHEEATWGFWPGDDRFPAPAFYAYIYPEPPGYRSWRAQPDIATYSQVMGEFILPYERLREESDPGLLVRQFLETTYEAAATTAGWDRAAIERR